MSGLKVAVAGAGLMGRMLAWSRARMGDAVTLIDRDDGGGSAGLAAAAMIAPATEAVVRDETVFRLGRAGLTAWRGLIGELAREEHPIYLNTGGTLVIAHADDRALWRGFRDMAAHRPGAAHFSVLDREQLAGLEPELAPRFAEALLFPDEGVLDNGALFSALERALQRLGAAWITSRDIGFIDELAREAAYDFICDTRGLGARRDQPDLRGVRGEVIRVHAPEVNLDRPVRLLHPRYPLYVAPHGDHRYVIGATEIESDAMHGVSVRSGLELLSALYTVHPGFGEAEILSLRAHCRPAYPDNLPRIRVNGNTLCINGLYRHGYLFAPALLEISNRVMAGQRQCEEFPWLVEQAQAGVARVAHG